MHFRHPFTYPSIFMLQEMHEENTRFCPLVRYLVRRTYGGRTLKSTVDFERKSIYYILTDFLFPPLPVSQFYRNMAIFSEVTLRRILWHTSNNISVNWKCATFAVRAIEFYGNEHRMDGVVYSHRPFNRWLIKILFVSNAKKMNICIHFPPDWCQLFFSSVLAICLKLYLNILLHTFNIVHKESFVSLLISCIIRYLKVALCIECCYDWFIVITLNSNNIYFL